MELQDRAWNPLASTEINKEDRFCELGMGRGGVYVLRFVGESHHRFSPAAICLINELLDSVCRLKNVVSRDEKAHLLITTNQGKFFSDGMDVNYLGCTDKERAFEYLMSSNYSCYKVKFLAKYTERAQIVKINLGHAVGVGCIFALALDHRLMSSDHCYIFMNEINLGMSMTPGIMSILRTKLPISTFQKVVVTGKRYDRKGAAVAGIVQETCPRGTTLWQEVINKASEYRARRWNREIYHALKMEIFKTTTQELENGRIGYARM